MLQNMVYCYRFLGIIIKSKTFVQIPGYYYKFRVIVINYDILLQIPEYYYKFLCIISKSKTLLQNPGVLQIPGYCYKIRYIIKNPKILFKTLWYYYKSRPAILLQILKHRYKFPGIISNSGTLPQTARPFPPEVLYIYHASYQTFSLK